jgi:hypothetical protein
VFSLVAVVPNVSRVSRTPARITDVRQARDGLPIVVRALFLRCPSATSPPPLPPLPFRGPSDDRRPRKRVRQRTNAAVKCLGRRDRVRCNERTGAEVQRVNELRCEAARHKSVVATCLMNKAGETSAKKRNQSGVNSARVSFTVRCVDASKWKVRALRI